jgi:hypothetical protein
MAAAGAGASEQHALRHVNVQLDLSRHSSGASTALSSITGIGGGHSFFGRGASVYTDQDEDEEDAESSISHHLQSQSNGDQQSQSQSQSSYSLLDSIDCLAVSAAANSRDSEYINNCDETSAFSSCLTPLTTGSAYANDNDAPSFKFSATPTWTSGDGSVTSTLLESHVSSADRSRCHHHHRAPALTTQTISGISTTQHPRGHGGGNTNNTSSTTHSSSRQTEVNDNDWQKIELEQENFRLVLVLHRSMQKERQLTEMADMLTKQMRKTLKENEDLTQSVQDLMQICKTLEKKKRHQDKENSYLYENNSMLQDILREVYASAEEVNKNKGKIIKGKKENKETSGTEEGIDEEKDDETKGGNKKDQDSNRELQQQLEALAKENYALLKERTKMLQMMRFGELQLDDCANQLQALKLKQKKKQKHHEQHDQQDYRDVRNNANGHRSRWADRLWFNYSHNSKTPSAVGLKQERRRAPDAGGEGRRTTPRRRSSSQPPRHHDDRPSVPPSSSTSNSRRAGLLLLKSAQTPESAKMVRFSSSSPASCSLAVKDDLARTLRGGLMASAKAKAKAKLNSISIAARNHPVPLRLE